jgi:Tfp pilus assembly major pilin PilA
MIRLADWPACLADEAIAAAIKGAAYEGYEQKNGRKTGLYRIFPA